MTYTLDFHDLYVNLVIVFFCFFFCFFCLVFFVLFFFFKQKNGASNIVTTAQMKFASQASQYIIPFGNIEPTCMPLSGHFMDIEGRVLLYKTERYQLILIYNAAW